MLLFANSYLICKFLPHQAPKIPPHQAQKDAVKRHGLQPYLANPRPSGDAAALEALQAQVLMSPPSITIAHSLQAPLGSSSDAMWRAKEVANAEPDSVLTNTPLDMVHSTLGGRGLVARDAVAPGALLLSELPWAVVATPTKDRRNVRALDWHTLCNESTLF